ncbi:MAG: hypothetical protein V7642_4277 [Burkholderiales bacterium]|jgi:hypothetical protein
MRFAFPPYDPGFPLEPGAREERHARCKSQMLRRHWLPIKFLRRSAATLDRCARFRQTASSQVGGTTATPSRDITDVPVRAPNGGVAPTFYWVVPSSSAKAWQIFSIVALLWAKSLNSRRPGPSPLNCKQFRYLNGDQARSYPIHKIFLLISRYARSTLILTIASSSHRKDRKK